MEIRKLPSSPNRNRRPPPGVIRAIVIHDTGGNSAKGAIEWLSSPKSLVSAHYVVDLDGTVYQLVPDEERAWHAGHSELFGERDVNSISLGIECVDANDKEPYPEAQMEALTDLVVVLCGKYRIPVNHVVGHQHVAPGRKVDPGRDFDWLGFLNRVGYQLHNLTIDRREGNGRG